MAVGTAVRMAARVWAVDYRMPPDHPFPAALDDCLAAYRALLAERPPERIVIGGASAGGNLAAALILRARDEGLPLPAAVVLMTPAPTSPRRATPIRPTWGSTRSSPAAGGSRSCSTRPAGTSATRTCRR